LAGSGVRDPSGGRGWNLRFSRGLSLIELLASIAIVAVLAGAALPMAEGYAKAAREAELKRHLLEMRAAIDRHYLDAHARRPDAPEVSKYPATLEELVAKKYLRRLPADPTTGRVDWERVPYLELPRPAGLFDVRSRNRAVSTTGEPYSSW